MGVYVVVHDPVHGSVELHPVCVTIIDTVQFQRLRNIKQLGLCYYVYPGASHNRFEHSIGTCHLAGEFIRHLRRHQPELNITDKDVLCVEIAALCHDLGHGPFSHFFDNIFIPEIEPGSQWKHELASVEMFQHILNENEGVRNCFRKVGLDGKDIKFIKNLINPIKEFVANENHTGRGVDKAYLYNIVANKENGVDVDKWDYFARDCHHLGLTNQIDHKRIIKFARVLAIDGKRTEICFRDKTALSFYHMFRSRFELHCLAYKHKAVASMNEMLKDAFVQADSYIRRQGKYSQLTLSKAKHDMTAYTQLTDGVFDEILYSNESKLQKAKDILVRIHQRKLYKFVGEKSFNYDVDCKKILHEIAPDDQELVDQLVIYKLNLDYTNGNEDPVHKIHFYSKHSINQVLPYVQLSYSSVIPKAFSERFIYLFCKNDDFLEKAKYLFNCWLEKTCTVS